MQWLGSYNIWSGLGEQAFWTGQIIVVLLLMGFSGWYIHHLFGVLEKRFARSRVGWDSAMLLAARSPARWLIWIVGVTWILQDYQLCLADPVAGCCANLPSNGCDSVGCLVSAGFCQTAQDQCPGGESVGQNQYH